MEHVRTKDNNSSPHPAESPAISLIQPDPSLPTPNRNESEAAYPSCYSPQPPTTNFQRPDKSRFLWFKLPQLKAAKPLFRGFERPSFFHIAALTFLCIIVYPAFHLLAVVAKDKSLFVVRLIVSVWCSGIGFALGYILLAIGAQHMEAATWATVIHMSYEGGGMKLRDLARGSGGPTSLLPALHILWSRFRNREARGRRKSYDKRPWSLLLGFFTVLAILAPMLPFLFGRIMEIKTFNQSRSYHEVLIAGDLTEEDVDHSRDHFDTSLFVWTTSGGSRSDAIKLIYDNDTIYLAQPSQSQFVPGGSGPGNLHQSDTSNTTFVLTGRNAPKSNTGAVLRYPQWGIRVHCEKLPNPEVNLIPSPNKPLTYVFLPRDFVRSLFRVYGMDLPMRFTGTDLGYLNPDDIIPSNINLSTISYVVALGSEVDDPVGLDSSDATRDQGWATLDTVLIRLNTSSTPSGRFPVYSNRTLPDGWAMIGYDAAVCVQRYESWVVETYNASIASPSILRIVGKGNGSTPLFPSGTIRGTPIDNTRYLNTTGKDSMFSLANHGALVRMWHSINLYRYYQSSEAIVSLTGGTGKDGYTELSPDKYAISRAQFGAVHALPFLAGSGHVVAQVYADETLAYVTYKWWQLIGLPILAWILGMIGELFVPKLPLDIPRREFGVYSWLALFKFQELQFEAGDDPGDKLMSLDELEERFSDKRVKFVAEKGEA